MKVRQDKDKYNIGTNIRKYRNEKKLKQWQVVAKMQLLGIDISRGYYAQIESGIANIKVVELLALCKIFDVPIEKFFDGMEIEVND